MAREKSSKVAEALGALNDLARALGHNDLAACSDRARMAFSKASGISDQARVEQLKAASDPTGTRDVGSIHKILSALEGFVHMCDPKVVGASRLDLVRDAMSAAARNPRLVEDVEAHAPSAGDLIETYIERLTDAGLSLEDFPLLVEEFLADSRLKAADQRKVIMRVTGAPPRRLSSIDNRRIELISWRRGLATDDRLFKSRAEEKRRF